MFKRRTAIIAPVTDPPVGWFPSTAPIPENRHGVYEDFAGVIPVEFDAGDYVIPTVNLEKGELFAFYMARPKWQRRLSWLIPAWRKARVYRGDEIKVQRLTDPDRIRISGPSGGPYWVDSE